MLISDMEGRPEWPKIVESVACPAKFCGAGVGQPCRQVSAAPGTLAAAFPRSDWHAERKYLAVTEWKEFKAEQEEKKLLPESEGGPTEPVEPVVTEEVPDENVPLDDPTENPEVM